MLNIILYVYLLKRILKTKNRKSESVREETFDGVLVAVGHHADPHFPKDEFPGK